MSYRDVCLRNHGKLLCSLSLQSDENPSLLLDRARRVITQINRDWYTAFADYYGLHGRDRPLGRFTEQMKIFNVHRAGEILDEVLATARAEKYLPEKYLEWDALEFFTHERALACGVTVKSLGDLRYNLEQGYFNAKVREFAEQTRGELIRQANFGPTMVDGMRKMMNEAGIKPI